MDYVSEPTSTAVPAVNNTTLPNETTKITAPSTTTTTIKATTPTSTKATSRTTKAPPRRETLKQITTTARSKTAASKLYIKYIFKSTRFFYKMLCRYFGHVFCHSWL